MCVLAGGTRGACSKNTPIRLSPKRSKLPKTHAERPPSEADALSFGASCRHGDPDLLFRVYRV